MKNHRILYLPRHPKLIKNGWVPAPEMFNQPKVISLCVDGKSLPFAFPDNFIWCKRDMGKLPVLDLK